MTYLASIGRLLWEVVRYGMASRRIWLALLLVASIGGVVLVAVVKVTAPLVLYPLL